MSKYDFSGYATRNDLLCGDGRTIRRDAFKDNDGETVPLVWNHQHNSVDNVLGHALLENRQDGVYAYCTFNDTPAGQKAKRVVLNGDIKALSIYANKLKQIGNDVVHGAIRELSLVHAGANPGAFIDFIMAHGEDSEDSIIAGYDENIMVVVHSDEDKTTEKQEDAPMAEEKKDNQSEKTVKEVWEDITNKLDEDEMKVVYAMIGAAAESAKETDSEEGEKDMKHNAFDQNEQHEEGVLSHSEMTAIFNDVKRYGTLKESFFAHAGDTEHAQVTQNYGVNGTDFLFPDAKNMTNAPIFIQRDMGWVQKVMKSVHHTPFSRIKSVFADITEEDARAKGYMKGKLKKDEVFGLLKRTTTPTTIYKKQKLDRDDVVDITDFDVVAWLKAEMRMMLDEEIARAILIGDGRSTSSDDKINEQNIRPIWKDEDLYTIKALVTPADNTDDARVKAFIRAAIKARKNYKGSGEPTLYTTEDVLTDCLLLEDANGHVLYDSVAKLANALRVKEIVTAPVMEGVTRTADDGTRELMGIIVNLDDYNVGADKGGAVNMFDDFDIDYNAQKYLIETRCSGALIKPYAAIALEVVSAG